MYSFVWIKHSVVWTEAGQMFPLPPVCSLTELSLTNTDTTAVSATLMSDDAQKRRSRNDKHLHVSLTFV